MHIKKEAKTINSLAAFKAFQACVFALACMYACDSYCKLNVIHEDDSQRERGIRKQDIYSSKHPHIKRYILI